MYCMILAIVLMFALVLTSIYDIATRTIPAYLMIAIGVITVIGFVFQRMNSISIWYTIVPIAVYLIITAINAECIKRNKPILFGGADNIALLAICAVKPVICSILPNVIIVPAGAIVLSTLCRLIPIVNRDFKTRGIPFIPFMGAVYIMEMMIG